MSGFTRLCKVVFALAGIFTLGALGLTWMGPWRDVASALMVVDGYWYALQICGFVTAIGLVVTLLRGLFSRKVRTVEVARVDGGSITVTREAIASQAANIVEADGTCAASKVIVDAKPRGHVRVHVRVLPHESLDVVVKGAQLHEELTQGLSAVCGNTVENVSLEFVKPQAYAPADSDTDSQGTMDADDAAQVPAETLADVTAEPASDGPTADSTSEITVSMGPARDAAKEA